MPKNRHKKSPLSIQIAGLFKFGVFVHFDTGEYLVLSILDIAAFFLRMGLHIIARE
jgi:predicted RNA-binding protein with RPS1 domain